MGSEDEEKNTHFGVTAVRRIPIDPHSFRLHLLSFFLRIPLYHPRRNPPTCGAARPHRVVAAARVHHDRSRGASVVPSIEHRTSSALSRVVSGVKRRAQRAWRTNEMGTLVGAGSISIVIDQVSQLWLWPNERRNQMRGRPVVDATEDGGREMRDGGERGRRWRTCTVKIRGAVPLGVLLGDGGWWYRSEGWRVKHGTAKGCGGRVSVSMVWRNGSKNHKGEDVGERDRQGLLGG
jgi:hypothetical protein